MSDKKVLIFGSFTEDETMLFHGKEDDKSVTPFEMMGLQFGSLDLNALSSVKGLGSGFKQNSSTKTKDFSAAALRKKKSNVDEAATVQAAKQSEELESNATATAAALRKKKSKVDDAASVQAAKQSEELESNVIANGCVAINGEEAIAGEGIHKGMNFLKICEENDTCSEDLPCSTVRENGLEMFKNSNGLLSTAVAVKDAENVQESNKHAPLFRGLLPRGLINLGNLCFLNSTLQALLSCSPFVQLLMDLKSRNVPKAGYPTLHAFVDLISEFCLPDGSNLKNDREIIGGGRPFSPMMFDTVLKKFTPDVQSGVSARPRQEDAQEFLSFLMDQMHDELLRLGGHLSRSNGGSSSLISASDDDEGWETIGPKNKSAITRTQNFMPSELSAIFGGQLRSVVKARGNKASATVQPFLLLHLDILPEAIHTIEDALRFFSAPETLEGYRASSGKAGLVNASKSVKIQTLSKIMILHLMRFSYGMRGSSKLNKPIHFPLEFVMGRDLLLTPSTEGRKYELVASITHHGREHSKGHYTADCRYSNGRWLRYDDSSITAVGLNKVLHDQAYVLFYKQV